MNTEKVRDVLPESCKLVWKLVWKNLKLPKGFVNKKGGLITCMVLSQAAGEARRRRHRRAGRGTRRQHRPLTARAPAGHSLSLEKRDSFSLALALSVLTKEAHFREEHFPHKPLANRFSAPVLMLLSVKAQWPRFCLRQQVPHAFSLDESGKGTRQLPPLPPAA